MEHAVKEYIRICGHSRTRTLARAAYTCTRRPLQAHILAHTRAHVRMAVYTGNRNLIYLGWSIDQLLMGKAHEL